MRIGSKELTRAKILRHIGNMNQGDVNNARD